MTAALPPVLLVVVLAGGPLSVGAADARASEPDTASAEDLFRRGVAAYDSAKYGLAIEFFRKSYGRAREPAILFNIARAYRALGDCAKALQNLDAFLEIASPEDPLAARARANRKEISVCIDEQRHGNSAPVPTLEPPAPLAPATEPHALPAPLVAVSSPTPPVSPVDLRISPEPRLPERGTSSRAALVCDAMVGSTVTLALAEVALLFTANRLAARVDAATIWTEDVQRADDQRAVLGTTSAIAGVALGVSAVATAGSCWLHWRRAHRFWEWR